MKILLIKPLLSKKSSFLFEPPLGLMYLSAFLKVKGYREIKIIHMDVERMTLEDLEKVIQEYVPDVVGLSASTAEAESMYRVAALTKKLFPNTVVVAGGPHPTSYPDDSLASGHFDIVVQGEGEETFLEIIEHLRDKESYQRIPGICFRHNGNIVTTEKRKYIDNLDQLPMPDWEAVDIEKYKEFWAQSRVIYREKYMPLFTSRGCPFRCIYCHSIFGKKFRAHSSSRVLEEIKILHAQFGITNFEFIDDIFNFDRQRTIDIMQGIIDSGLKLKLYFPSGVRGDILDESLIDLFAKAGTVFMSIAVETASPRLQEEIQKHLNLAKVKRLIAYAVRKKIFVNGLFMFGFPNESTREMLGTIQFAVTSSLQSGNFFLVHPFKGTQLGECLEKKGKNIVTMYNSVHFTLVTQDSINCSRFSNKQLKLIFILAYVLFYFNPFRMFRIFRNLPNKKAFKPLFLLIFIRVFLNREMKRYGLGRAS